jgi:hypothetical protein
MMFLNHLINTTCSFFYNNPSSVLSAIESGMLHLVSVSGLSLFGAVSAAAAASTSTCSSAPVTLHLPDAPYDNFFYSDCHTAVQVVVTSPQADSDLTTVSPRFIAAWPAGNSGIAAYFAPQDGENNGSLSIQVVDSTVGSPLAAIYRDDSSGSSTTSTPYFGVTGTLRFNSSASLTTPILGSIRTIRDFSEGASLLQPQIQDAIKASSLPNGGAGLQRLWLDNITTTHLNFTPATNGSVTISDNNQTLNFEAGDYIFVAEFNYPQLTQLSPAQVLSNTSSASLIQNDPERTAALSFLSYSDKLLAGAWRFLTYFGRDSMISALLLEPVLSKGENSATEAVIAAVLERLDRADGSVCHEETIG